MSNIIRLSNNKIKARDLVLTGKDFFESEDFIVRESKINFRYEDGKRTEIVDGVSYSCVDPLTFNSVTFKVETKRAVIEQKDIDNATEPVHLTVPISEAVIKIYKMEFGIISVSITVPYVKLSEE